VPRLDRLYLAAAGISLLASVVLILLDHPYEPSSDAAGYALMAESMTSGDGFSLGTGEPTALRGPVYPVVLGTAFALTGDSLLAGQLLTAAFGALSVLLLCLLVDVFWGRRPALAAGLLAATFPPLLILNVAFFSEPVFLCLQLAALLGLVVYEREQRGLALPAAIGVVCGLATLTRSNGLLLLVLLALAVGLATAGGRRRALTAGAVTIAAGALAIAPWSLRNAVVFDQAVPLTTQSGENMYSLFNDESKAGGADARLQDLASYQGGLVARGLDEAERDDALREKALEYALDDPGYLLEVIGVNGLRNLQLHDGAWTGFEMYGLFGVRDNLLWELLAPSSYLLYALAIAGVVVLVRNPALERPPWVFYVAPALLVLTATVMAAGSMRYRAPLDPVLLAFAGLALATLWERLQRPRMRSATNG
jgi:4-amino-4-deoxy-L-arabinose transferase-like glycosyltransferase